MSDRDPARAADSMARDDSPLKGQPTNPDELSPKELQPDPPEGGNRQPRDPDAIETEPGLDL